MIQLRDYQQRSVDGVRNAYSNGFKAPLLVLPTGGGKTIVFCYIAVNAAAKGKRVLILVHRDSLLKQTIKSLEKFGIRCGIISPHFTADPSAVVQVAMVQTMINKLHFYQHFDLIITDECHHATSPTYVKILQYYTTYQLGVTATPIRTDGRGLGEIYDTMIIGPTVSELIGLGWLVKPRVFGSPQALDLSSVKKTRSGDFNQKQISEIMNKPHITGNAVHHYLDLARCEPGVAFCTSVKHAEETAAEFRKAGFRFYALHGKTEDKDRDKLIRMLGDGTIHGLTSCDVISEGTDIPEIAVAMMLRPTQSLGLYLQQGGRALRPSAGKDCAIILDHAGNTYRHGLLEQDREWSLEGERKKGGRRKKKEKGEPAPHQCEECYFVFDYTLDCCPNCGKKVDIKVRKIRVVEGTLQELTAEDKLRIKRQQKQETYQAQGLEALQALGKKRGYKPGWALRVHKSRLDKAAKKKAEKEAAKQNS